MKQNRQRGYVVTYVIVGVILAAIALATLYGLRQLSAQNQVVSSTETTSEQQKEAKEAVTDNKSAEKKNDEQKNTSSSESNKSTQNQSTQPTQNNNHGSSRLPSTGPADSLAVGFALGIIVAAGFAYRRSVLAV